MTNKFLVIQTVFTNLLLLVILGVLIFVAAGLKQDSSNDRYSFSMQSQTQELYVFDKKTSKLFITSPEVIGDYGKEMWTELNPAAGGNAVPFKQLLNEKSGIELRKKFLRELNNNNGKKE
ncbi:MAG: hypothetical protein ABII88_03365 [Candidatus Omnitrophota bacterium]